MLSEIQVEKDSSKSSSGGAAITCKLSKVAPPTITRTCRTKITAGWENVVTPAGVVYEFITSAVGKSVVEATAAEGWKSKLVLGPQGGPEENRARSITNEHMINTRVGHPASLTDAA